MSDRTQRQLTSKQLMEKIGLGNGLPDVSDLLEEELDNIENDLVAQLRSRYTSLKEDRHVFTAGQVIRWKAGLKNRRWPAYGKPCIVLSVLPESLMDTDEPGSTYYREPLDLVVGLFLDSGEHSGEFLAFHCNSERYEPFPGGEG